MPYTKFLTLSADLKFLYDDPYQGRGARRKYDGKVNLHDPQRFQLVSQLEEGVSLYTAVVWSVSLKRKVPLAYLLQADTSRPTYVVLFSTDLEIDPVFLYRCYAARFQIEFVFRHARQFTGLADCQFRLPESIDIHVNASLMALNLAKAALQQSQPTTDPLSFSIASLKRLALNVHLLDVGVA